MLLQSTNSSFFLNTLFRDTTERVFSDLSVGYIIGSRLFKAMLLLKVHKWKASIPLIVKEVD